MPITRHRRPTSRVAQAFAIAILLVAGTQAAPARSADARTATELRERGEIAYLGDSRLAAQFDDPAQLVQSARFFGNAAAQLLNGRLRTALNLAVSGWRTDQYLTDEAVDRVIATRAGWVAIFGVLNDIVQRGPGDYFGGVEGGLPGGVRRQVERLLAAGLRPILVLDPGAAALTGDAPRIASLASYNAAVRAFAADHPEIVVFDMPAVVVEPGSAHVYRPGYASDGTHLDTLGGVETGRAFAALMDPLLSSEAPQVEAAPLTPATALQGAGGAAGEGVSGVVPASYHAACTPGVAAEIAVSPAADEAAARMVLNVRATAAGRCTVAIDLSGEATGERFNAAATAEVAAGATGLAGPFLQLESNRDGASRSAFDNDGGLGGAGPSDARVLYLRTPTVEIAAGNRGWFMSGLGVVFAGPGAATVAFADHRVGKIETR